MVENRIQKVTFLIRSVIMTLLMLIVFNGFIEAQETQLPDTTLACYADSALLDAGAGFQSYLWNTNEQTQTIWAQDTGWYYVLCTLESMEVVEDSTWFFHQNAYIDITDTILTCYTYPVSLCVVPDTLMYKWTSSDPDMFIQFNTAACIEVTPEQDTTTIYVFITDSANVMTCVDSVQIWLYPRMRFDEVNQINTGCPGTCKGQLEVIVSGGLPPYQYLWPTTNPVQWDSIAFGLCESSYKIEVKDQYFCVRDTILPVEVYDMPEVKIVREPEGKIYIQNPVVNFSFENLSTDSLQVIDWNWDFGDSTYTKEENPVKVFEQVRKEGYDVWLKYTTSDECIDSVTVNVDVGRVELHVPNIFTPNGDEFNQYFVIDSLENYISNEIKIFNRYGKRVYSKTDYQGDWDAQNLREGVYFYVLKAEGYFGTDVFQGSVTIMR